MREQHELEEAIGYSFSNAGLLAQALTHSSYAHERHLTNADNERLEYLGDAVLELVTSEFLYGKYPECPEGELTRIRAALVCEVSLNETAVGLDLGNFIRMAHGEEKTGGRKRKSILSDAVEAMIGAMYLDGGYEPAKAFIHRFVLVNTEKKALFHDAKSLLQEETQGRGMGRAVYEIIDQSGPDHAKTFRVAVYVQGEKMGEGEGHTKKDAEKEASYVALMKLKGN